MTLVNDNTSTRDFTNHPFFVVNTLKATFLNSKEEVSVVPLQKRKLVKRPIEGLDDVPTVTPTIKKVEQYAAVKTTELKINKYITEVNKDILEVLDYNNVKKILVKSSMGTGKSYFVMNDLLNWAKNVDAINEIANEEEGIFESRKVKGCKVILTLPNTFNVQELEYDLQDQIKAHKVCTLYEGQTYDSRAKLIISTPDSLNKIDFDKDDNFVLVFDEAHTEVTQLFRKKAFKIVREVSKKAAVYKTLFFTATGDMFFKEEFDKVIEVVANQRIAIDKFNILQCDKISLATIQRQALEMVRLYKKVIIVNDDKELNEKLKNVIEEELKLINKNTGIEERVITYNSETDKDHIEIQAIKNSKDLKEGTRAMICTCAFTSGINLYINKDDFAMLYIIKDADSFRREDMIQASGRNRLGIKEFRVLTKKYESTTAPISNFDVLYKDVLDAIQNGIRRANRIFAGRIMHQSHVRKYYGLNAKGIDIVDNVAKVNVQEVKSLALDSFNSQLIYNVNSLKENLMKQTAINIPVVSIGTVSAELTETEKEREKELRELKKSIKEETKLTVNEAFVTLKEAYFEVLKEETEKDQSIKADTLFELPFVKVQREDAMMKTMKNYDRQSRDLNYDLELMDGFARKDFVYSITTVAAEKGLTVKDNVAEAVLVIRKDLDLMQQICSVAYNSRKVFVVGEDEEKDKTSYKDVLKDIVLGMTEGDDIYKVVKERKNRLFGQAIYKEMKIDKTSEMTLDQLKEEIKTADIKKSLLADYNEYKLKAIRIALDEAYEKKGTLTNDRILNLFTTLAEMGLVKVATGKKVDLAIAEMEQRIEEYNSNMALFNKGELKRKPTTPKFMDIKTGKIQEQVLTDTKKGMSASAKAALLKDVKYVFNVSEKGRITGLNK